MVFFSGQLWSCPKNPSLDVWVQNWCVLYFMFQCFVFPEFILEKFLNMDQVLKRRSIEVGKKELIQSFHISFLRILVGVLNHFRMFDKGLMFLKLKWNKKNGQWFNSSISFHSHSNTMVLKKAFYPPVRL